MSDETVERDYTAEAVLPEEYGGLGKDAAFTYVDVRCARVRWGG